MKFKTSKEQGIFFEKLTFRILEKLGKKPIKMSYKDPYDIFVDGIRIDVKSGRKYRGYNGKLYYMFEGKATPKCDIYLCYGVNDDDNIDVIYAIPAQLINTKTISTYKGKWNKYKIFAKGEAV